MGGTRRCALAGVLIAALMYTGCDASQVDQTAPDTATPEVATGDVASLPETAGDPPPTSAGTAPAVSSATTQAAALLPSSEATDEAEAADAGAAEDADPPAVRRPLAPRDTSADVPAEEQIETAFRTMLASSFPDRHLTLQSDMVQGDLSHDGNDDYVLHVVEEASGSPPTSWLVPAVDAGGAFRFRSPIELGRNVLVEAIEIRDGRIEVSLFDRSPYEPPTVITRRTTLSVSLGDPDDTVTATRVEPIHNVPSLQITRPPVAAAFGLDAAAFGLDSLRTAVSDRIELRQRHPYVVHASDDDVVVATLDAPDGVWLEARLDPDTVLVPVAEQTQRFASRLPAGGAWDITVVSSLIEPADYRLAIEVLPPGEGDRLATRDLDGFWSSTRTSPPAVPDDGPVIYLTFDDGPHPVYTPQVLDVLAKHGAQATFFVVGYLAERYPLIVQRIAHEGHTLANHSWDHRSLARMSRAAFDRSVGRTQEVLGPLATPCIRPPYYLVGRYTQQWSAEHGLRLASWSYSPQDWKGPSATTIADRLVATASPGAVLLLHDGGGDRSATVRGLDMALGRLAGSGLVFRAQCR